MLASFQPQGNTLILASTAASATTVQPSSASSIQGLRAVNTSTSVTAYATVSASSATVATLPTTVTPSTGTGFPLLPSQTEIFSVPPNCWVSAITSAGQANLALTPGVGL